MEEISMMKEVKSIMTSNYMNSQKKKQRFITVLLIVLIAGAVVGCVVLARQKNTPQETTSEDVAADTLPSSTPDKATAPSISPQPSTGTVANAGSDWSFMINDIQKRDRFMDVYGSYATPITLRIVDPDSEAIILEVSDFTTKSTNLNALVPSGTNYYLRFYDANGALMAPAWPNVKTLH